MLSSVALLRGIMEQKTQQQGLLLAGVLLTVQTFTTLAPSGPWDSPSFSRGVLGLLGLMILYVWWFKRTFGFYGVAPTVNRWKDRAS